MTLFLEFYFRFLRPTRLTRNALECYQRKVIYDSCLTITFRTTGATGMSSTRLPDWHRPVEGHLRY